MRARRWLLGTDLGQRSDGALRFGAWIAGQGQSEGGPLEMRAVHVLEDQLLAEALRLHHLDEVVGPARKSVEQALRDAGFSPSVSIEADVMTGGDADVMLDRVSRKEAFDAIVVGRCAPGTGTHLVRLGRVARRILRRAQVPVIVVPPDWQPPKTTGPVLVATGMHHECELALRFGADLADGLKTTLEAVHATPAATDAASYLPDETLATIAQQQIAGATRTFEAWLTARAPKVPAHVVAGSAVAQTAQCGSERHAALIVTGARRRGSFERLLLPSTSTELAAVADRPVAVVNGAPE